MPEIALRVCKFNCDLPSAALFGIDVNYPALALFFGETIDDENLLAELDARLHVEQPTVQAHRHRGGYIAEGMVPGSPSVNFHGNGKWEALATAAFNHGNSFEALGLSNWRTLKLGPATLQRNGTPLINYITRTPQSLRSKPLAIDETASEDRSLPPLLTDFGVA